MEYTISNDLGTDVCLISMAGNVSAERAIKMLDFAWHDDIYANAKFVIWDLENCDAFPDFNEFVLIANHARKHKPQNGPTRIAFCSTTFENSMLVKVLKGFTRALPSKVQYLTTQNEALAWFATNESDAA